MRVTFDGFYGVPSSVSHPATTRHSNERPSDECWAARQPQAARRHRMAPSLLTAAAPDGALPPRRRLALPPLRRRHRAMSVEQRGSRRLLPQMAPSLLDAASPFLLYSAAAAGGSRRPLAAATTGRHAASSLRVGALKYCRIYKPYHRIYKPRSSGRCLLHPPPQGTTGSGHPHAPATVSFVYSAAVVSSSTPPPSSGRRRRSADRRFFVFSAPKLMAGLSFVLVVAPKVVEGILGRDGTCFRSSCALVQRLGAIVQNV
uniref:Uncharacterized protein n=1 Tax=Oryza sativa subsp. japonica TaxID=39947 RepID=Q6H446_ORYSJ|nr:hypothetical protein [Oryza sativa Japonica Group]BAD26503.1 hypothetical protein [Oryza sativa Japonica Group]